MCECVYVEVIEHATSCVKTGICVIVRVRVHTKWHTSYIRSAPMSVFIVLRVADGACCTLEGPSDPPLPRLSGAT